MGEEESGQGQNQSVIEAPPISRLTDSLSASVNDDLKIVDLMQKKSTDGIFESILSKAAIQGREISMTTDFLFTENGSGFLTDEAFRQSVVSHLEEMCDTSKIGLGIIPTSDSQKKISFVLQSGNSSSSLTFSFMEEDNFAQISLQTNFQQDAINRQTKPTVDEKAFSEHFKLVQKICDVIYEVDAKKFVQLVSEEAHALNQPDTLRQAFDIFQPVSTMDFFRMTEFELGKIIQNWNVYKTMLNTSETASRLKKASAFLLRKTPLPPEQTNSLSAVGLIPGESSAHVSSDPLQEQKDLVNLLQHPDRLISIVEFELRWRAFVSDQEAGYRPENPKRLIADVLENFVTQAYRDKSEVVHAFLAGYDMLNAAKQLDDIKSVIVSANTPPLAPDSTYTLDDVMVQLSDEVLKREAEESESVSMMRTLDGLIQWAAHHRKILSRTPETKTESISFAHLQKVLVNLRSLSTMVAALDDMNESRKLGLS